jgi:NitT/TauT family transport system permease protein
MLLGLASLIVLWVVLVTAGLVNRRSLPLPTSVLGAFVELAGDTSYWADVADTLTAWAVTLLILVAVSVPLGILASSLKWLTRPSWLVINTFRSIPATAMLPVAILTFGLGQQMKWAVAVYAVMWPMLINTMYGIQSTDPMRLDAARALRWSWLRIRLLVTLPSALPSIMTGLRIATGMTLVVILSAELLGAEAGAGRTMRIYQQADRPAFVYASILIIGVIGAVSYSAITLAERRFVTWATQV